MIILWGTEGEYPRHLPLSTSFRLPLGPRSFLNTRVDVELESGTARISIPLFWYVIMFGPFPKYNSQRNRPSEVS